MPKMTIYVPQDLHDKMMSLPSHQFHRVAWSRLARVAFSKHLLDCDHITVKEHTEFLQK